MTNNIIKDTDALLSWINNNLQSGYYLTVDAADLIKKINELATPAPEPQEIIFEEIPEIERILESYYKPEKTYHVNFQCSVLFGYGMTKEEAEKKRDEWNAGHDYEPPAGVFEDDDDFSGLCLEPYEDEFKLLLRDYIERKNAIPTGGNHE